MWVKHHHVELGGGWNYCTPPFLYCCLDRLVRNPFTASRYSLPTTAPTLAGENAHLPFVQLLSHGPVWEYRGRGKRGKKLSQLERAPRCCLVVRPSSQVLSKYIWMRNVKDNVEILPIRCEYSTLWESATISTAFRGRPSVKGAGNSSRQCFLQEYQCAGLRMWSEIVWGH